MSAFTVLAVAYWQLRAFLGVSCSNFLRPKHWLVTPYINVCPKLVGVRLLLAAKKLSLENWDGRNGRLQKSADTKFGVC